MKLRLPLEQDCSLEGMKELAWSLSAELQLLDRVLLEGEMGTGKSTFARFLLEALEVREQQEGSPTFPIAHEYETRLGTVAHIDFYRLRSEDEIEEAGLGAYFWEKDCIVFSEWTSRMPEFLQSLKKDRRRNIFLTLEFCESNPQERRIRISF